MNLPNRLSLTRAALMPVAVVLLYLRAPWGRWAALIVFALAALTDFLDGHIARSRGLVTPFGQFIDPLADKMLVLGLMTALVGKDQLPFWVLLVILTRDLAVDALRLVAAQQGTVIAAGKSGKVKTCVQIALILYLIAFPTSWQVTGANPGKVLTALALVCTVYSGCEYLARNRAVFSEKAGK